MNNKIFSYLGYYTEYEYKIQEMKDYKKAGNTACFSEALSNMRTKFDIEKEFSGSYRIRIYRTKCKIKESKNNFCLLSKKEIRDYINILKKVVDFKWRFLKDNKDYFTVKVDIPKGYHTTHRAVLFWIRNLYEFPNNVYVKDAELFRKDHKYNYIGALNIHKLVYLSNEEKNGSHAIFDNSFKNLGTLDEYREACNSCEGYYLSDAIGKTANSIKKSMNYSLIINESVNFKTLEFWNEPDNDCPQRKDRFEVYSKNLKLYTRKR